MLLTLVHRTCGSKLVSTTPLRLIGHDRQVICVVSSEWSAYVNPWSGQIEMVVGRHTPLFLSASSQLIALREEHVLRAQDASVHRLLTKVRLKEERGDHYESTQLVSLRRFLLLRRRLLTSAAKIP